MTEVKSHREKQTDQCARKTQRPKEFEVKRSFFAKMLQGSQTSEGLA